MISFKSRRILVSFQKTSTTHKSDISNNESESELIKKIYHKRQKIIEYLEKKTYNIDLETNDYYSSLTYLISSII